MARTLIKIYFFSFIIILVFIIGIFSYAAKNEGPSLNYYAENNLLNLKYKIDDHKFPNFLAENRQEEEKILRFPDPLPAPARQLSVPILMYHNIANIPPGSNQLQKGLTVSTNDFEQQLNYLEEKGYQTVLMSDLFKALYHGYKLPLKPIILTFDDGYNNAYYNAFTILKKYKSKGSFYIITSLIGQPGRLSWNEIKDMNNQGMEIGSHTMNHPDLSGQSSDIIISESGNSKTIIEDKIGRKIYSFCYPAGAYRPEFFDILKNQGYLLTLTTHNGTIEDSNHPFELPRIRIPGGITLDSFKNMFP
jgi:peptidoglycan/xylan/chitin deacetylase (PgdA/CDA1 family)